MTFTIQEFEKFKTVMIRTTENPGFIKNYETFLRAHAEKFNDPKYTELVERYIDKCKKTVESKEP